MYRIVPHPPAQAAVSALPDGALPGYAEAMGVLKLVPWEVGRPWDDANPGGNIHTLPFSDGGLLTYLILERDQEVHILEVHWSGV